MIGGMADELQLRPPREDDLALIEKLTQDPATAGEFAWFGWHNPLRWRRSAALSGRAGAGPGLGADPVRPEFISVAGRSVADIQ